MISDYKIADTVDRVREHNIKNSCKCFVQDLQEFYISG